MKRQLSILCLAPLLLLTATLAAQISQPAPVPWYSATPPTSCPGAIPIYIIAPGYTGAGTLYGNTSTTTGTSCSALNTTGGSSAWSAITAGTNTQTGAFATAGTWTYNSASTSTPLISVNATNNTTGVSFTNNNSIAAGAGYTPLNSLCTILASNGYCYGAIIGAFNNTSNTGYTHAVALETETTVGNYNISTSQDAYGVAVGMNLEAGHTFQGYGVRVEFGTPTVDTGLVQYGFGTQNGVASIGMELGGVVQDNTLNAGTNLTGNSQALNFHGVNAGTQGPDASLYADDLGNLNIAGSSGQDINLNTATYLPYLTASTTPLCYRSGVGITNISCSNTPGNSYYQTVQLAGSALPQEPIINFTSNMTCSDSPGTTSTNCAPSSSAGSAFSSITGGTNTAAAMLVGTGASLGPTGSGTVTANAITSGTNVSLGTVAGSTGTFTGAVSVEGAAVANASLAINTVAYSGTNAYGIYGLLPTGATNNYAIALYNAAGSTVLFTVNSSGLGVFNSSVNAGGPITASNSSPEAIQTVNTTAATSGACSVSGAFNFTGKYWTGSASANNTTSLTPSCTAGTNGAETLTAANATGSTGAFTFAVTGTISPSVGLALAGAQSLTSVQGTAGTKLPAASGSFTNGNFRSTNSTGDEVDSGISATGLTIRTGTVAITANATALTCTTGTSSISGAATTMAAFASAAGTADLDTTAPQAYVSAAGTVTVQVCTIIADAAAPSITYNIRVIP